MNKLILAAASAALTLSSAATAQNAQERLDGRYDRALAAGYKALFLCSAMANAEANGVSRTPESVHEWELTGIQAPLDDIVRDLPYEIVRRPSGQIAEVQVEWVEDMPSRIAVYHGRETGCSVTPIGTLEGVSEPERTIDQPSARELEEAGSADAATNERLTIEALKKGSGRATISVSSVQGPLVSVFEQAFAADETAKYGEGARTTAILVRTLKADGEPGLEVESYAPGFSAVTPQRTWSVAKSIAATLIGMAVQSNEHKVTDPINLNYWRIGGSREPRNAITIDHALRMATGRYSDTPGNRTDPIYWGGASVEENATKWPLVREPGTVYRYANNDTLLAVKAVEQYFDFYTVPTLLKKIGMINTVVETDWRGNYVLSSQVWSTARDLATLGELYLRDGIAPDGERVLPENWRDYVSDPSGPQPEGTQWGYGAGWWTFRRPDFNSFDGIPDDAFAARGNRGQYVVVVPSRNVVIVRRGEDMVGTRFDIAAFTRDVLAALE